MPAGLDNIINSYSGLLVTAGFALMPLGTAIKDQTNQIKKYHQLNLAAGPERLQEYGGGFADYRVLLELELHWNPEIDTSTTRATVAGDVELATVTMIKVSNRQTEVIIVNSEPGSTLNRQRPDDWVWTGHFSLDYRMTQDLT